MTRGDVVKEILKKSFCSFIDGLSARDLANLSDEKDPCSFEKFGEIEYEIPDEYSIRYNHCEACPGKDECSSHIIEIDRYSLEEENKIIKDYPLHIWNEGCDAHVEAFYSEEIGGRNIFGKFDKAKVIYYILIAVWVASYFSFVYYVWFKGYDVMRYIMFALLIPIIFIPVKLILKLQKKVAEMNTDSDEGNTETEGVEEVEQQGSEESN